MVVQRHNGREYVLKIEPLSFSNIFDIECERKKGDQYCSKDFSYDKNNGSEADVLRTGESEG